MIEPAPPRPPRSPSGKPEEMPSRWDYTIVALCLAGLAFVAWSFVGWVTDDGVSGGVAPSVCQVEDR